MRGAMMPPTGRPNGRRGGAQEGAGRGLRVAADTYTVADLNKDGSVVDSSEVLAAAGLKRPRRPLGGARDSGQ
jgi:hypothetical protein